MRFVGCREVTAAGELMVEVWDLGGTRGAKQMKKLADNPSQVIRNSRFLGQAEIPLVDTLTDTQRGDHAGLSAFNSVWQTLGTFEQLQFQSSNLQAPMVPDSTVFSFLGNGCSVNACSMLVMTNVPVGVCCKQPAGVSKSCLAADASCTCWP